jgi:hypothetical protein
MRDTYPPDGAQPAEEEARRHRFLTTRVCPDGMVEGTFRVSPEAGAVVLGVLHSQAAPMPAADGTPDPRSYGQLGRLGEAECRRPTRWRTWPGRPRSR